MSYSIWTVLRYILFSVGTHRVLTLCGEKGWMGFVPGLRYFKLGEIASKEPEGRVAGVSGVAAEVVSLLAWLLRGLGVKPRFLVLFTAIEITLTVIKIIYGLRVASGLCRTFSVSRNWLALWMFFPEICLLVWGYGSQYDPVNLGMDDGNTTIAGLTPADTGTRRELQGPSDEGLYVDIRSRTVREYFSKRYLLNDIEFTIPDGSLVLLLGGSGAGKTTLINAITGYEKADATILLNGADLYKEYDRLKYKVGMVPQQELMRMSDTVQHTLNDAALLRLPADVGKKERNEKVGEVMETLGLEPGKDGLVAKKSGGQKKRVSIGIELITDPELFILDEPDSGLDGVIARELFERLREIADTGKIVIVITHTPDRVIDLFDKVIVLARDSNRVGRLAFFGSPQEAREFFGKKTMEEIVMSINRRDEGGEGRADEFIAKYDRMTGGDGGSSAAEAGSGAEAAQEGATEPEAAAPAEPGPAAEAEPVPEPVEVPAEPETDVTSEDKKEA